MQKYDTVSCAYDSQTQQQNWLKIKLFYASTKLCHNNTILRSQNGPLNVCNMIIPLKV